MHAHEETLQLLCYNLVHRGTTQLSELVVIFFSSEVLCSGKKLERNKTKPKQLLSSCASSSSITAHQTMQASGYDFMKAFVKCPAKQQLDSQYSHCIANCQPITASDQLPQCSSLADEGTLRLRSTRFCRRLRMTYPKTSLLNRTSQPLR